MDGQVGDHHQVAVDVDQFGLYPFVGLDQRAACHRQRAVKPGGEDHAAVFFGVELHIFALDLLLRVVLNLEGRGVAVAGNDVEGSKVLARHLEGDDGGEVAGNKIFAALLQLPFFIFKQLLKALLYQCLFDIVDDVEAAWRFFDKVKQFLHLF